MKTLLIVGALPLLVYPAVFLASIMSLAGHKTGREPALQMLVARSFQISTLLYPVVYIVALIAALLLRNRAADLAGKVATLPLWYLGLIVLLFIAWVRVGKQRS